MPNKYQPKGLRLQNSKKPSRKKKYVDVTTDSGSRSVSQLDINLDVSNQELVYVKKKNAHERHYQVRRATIEKQASKNKMREKQNKICCVSFCLVMFAVVSICYILWKTTLLGGGDSDEGNAKFLECPEGEEWFNQTCVSINKGE